MGYTTRFNGEISLSRKLTIAEAKFILDIAYADREDAAKITGVDSYLQWVPTETLDAIVWDGNEKFYDYELLMKWLCGWLEDAGVAANGTLRWSGETPSDTWSMVVAGNRVWMMPNAKKKLRAGSPLTLEKLGEMAIKIASETA